MKIYQSKLENNIFHINYIKYVHQRVGWGIMSVRQTSIVF